MLLEQFFKSCGHGPWIPHRSGEECKDLLKAIHGSLIRWQTWNEEKSARIAELEAEVAHEKGHHDFYRGKVSDYMGAEIEWKKLTDDLRAQNQLWFDNCACENPCNDPEPWITTRKAISKLQTERAAVTAATPPASLASGGEKTL